MYLSIIMPFYKRVESLALSLIYNEQHLAKPGIELVLCLDEPTQEQEVIALMKSYTNISCKVIVNDNDHTWRNPSKAINVGILNASGRHCLVMSPESIFANDLPSELSHVIKEVSSGAFSVGQILWMTKQDLRIPLVNMYKDSTDLTFYGSICVPTIYLKSIRGYDETNLLWGADDDNIRKRLQLHGLNKIECANAKMIHIAVDKEPVKIRNNHETMEELYSPKLAIVNDKDWGTDFKRIAYLR